MSSHITLAQWLTFVTVILALFQVVVEVSQSGQVLSFHHFAHDFRLACRFTVQELVVSVVVVDHSVVDLPQSGLVLKTLSIFFQILRRLGLQSLTPGAFMCSSG